VIAFHHRTLLDASRVQEQRLSVTGKQNPHAGFWFPRHLFIFERKQQKNIFFVGLSKLATIL
jgi:hypothetical protein